MFLTIKNIPKTSWSSKEPLNLKPRFSTFFFLCFGLTLFGIGEGLLLVSYTGASPWSVLAQGISNYVDFSIGTITFFISVFVIFLWIFLNQKPGMGTMLNAIIIAFMIDISLTYINTPEEYFSKHFNSYDFNNEITNNINSKNILFLKNIDGINLYTAIKKSESVVAPEGIVTHIGYRLRKNILSLMHFKLKDRKDFINQIISCKEWFPPENFGYIVLKSEFTESLRKLSKRL